ncbi:MAG: 3-oxoacyl-ACP reductase FabG [Deltaproteobacteria bacterium]|nr:3-oxoacyl-ACP reductase FabG [Deltaproteobacteria bacterium]
MTDLQGKIALVTGASRGIGRAIAVGLAGCGADIAVNYKTRENEARITQQQVISQGRRSIIIQADVSRSSEVGNMIAAVEKDLGPVDILVNNAGIARFQSVEATTEADWDEVLTANLKSVFLVTQAVLPGMRRRRWGRIINISSGAAKTGGGVGLHYTASKAGIEGLTRAYASRLVKEGITVTAVAPSLIATDMIPDEEGRRKQVPLGRLGRVDEVAEAVIFLAGNEYATGQVIALNGGMYFR